MPRAATVPAVERKDALPKTHGLVVEGNPGDLIVYCEMLEQLGCKVLACTTPEEAVVDMECYLEAMQLGAVDYVEKPLKALDLRRAAGRGLASCREAA